MITIKKGFNLPISGIPEQYIDDIPEVTRAAVLGIDYVGMRPAMKVKVGDSVKAGSVLFEDKKSPGVVFTSPVSGVISEINRGEKRALQSVVVDIKDKKFIEFKKYNSASISSLPTSEIRDNLIASGQWTSIRTRPYSKIPDINSDPDGVFVNAIDTNPLAANPLIVIEDHKEAFLDGLLVISKISNNPNTKFFLTKESGINVPSIDSFMVREFSGVHPAGLVGTHIHYLMPVSANRVAWHLNYQDVIAIGYLFQNGKVYSDRVVSLAGPRVSKPRLIKTIVGADIKEIVNGNINNPEQESRVISGSVLHGTNAKHDRAYLGRYHLQVSVIKEDRDKELFGWLSPGINKVSVTRAFASHINFFKLFDMTSSTCGSSRSMIPLGSYEDVMPLDILPSLLLRDLISGDTDSAQKLGCLELDEEDLALCTFVCPGKYDYGLHLRKCLEIIERDG